MSEPMTNGCGKLPKCGKLAMAYVPMQEGIQPNYPPMDALSRGTLFPGLDLPFMCCANPTGEMTAESELMAISFVCDELCLFLDTHPEDHEAFELLQTMLRLKKEAHERYTERFGPVCHADLLHQTDYRSILKSWPWELMRGEE